MPDANKTCTMLLALALCLSAVVLIGCESTHRDPSGPDRVIPVAPIRNLEAAEQANKEGLDHLDAGKLTDAELAFKRAIEADRNFGPAHNHLGKVYFLRRRYYLAAHQFDKASQLLPNHAAPHNNLGLTLIEAGKLDEAVVALRLAVSMDPYNIEYQANLVRTLVQRGDETQELVTLLRSVATNDERLPWRVWASHELGQRGIE